MFFIFCREESKQINLKIKNSHIFCLLSLQFQKKQKGTKTNLFSFKSNFGFQNS